MTFDQWADDDLQLWGKRGNYVVDGQDFESALAILRAITERCRPELPELASSDMALLRHLEEQGGADDAAEYVLVEVMRIAA